MSRNSKNKRNREDSDSEPPLTLAQQAEMPQELSTWAPGEGMKYGHLAQAWHLISTHITGNALLISYQDVDKWRSRGDTCPLMEGFTNFAFVWLGPQSAHWVMTILQPLDDDGLHCIVYEPLDTPHSLIKSKMSSWNASHEVILDPGAKMEDFIMPNDNPLPEACGPAALNNAISLQLLNAVGDECPLLSYKDFTSNHRLQNVLRKLPEKLDEISVRVAKDLEEL